MDQARHFSLMDAAEVCEMVPEAILANRVMLPTHANVRGFLVQRASDWYGLIDRQIDDPPIVARATK
ncbi:hypothetical protein [Novosphingobium sp. BL-52-GroH]|uniref:hypothetical protein n=1 Tax=Novosphingobium sp. BL-52-GroH TaxID=3349877 RepID=UPI00384B93FB